MTLIEASVDVGFDVGSPGTAGARLEEFMAAYMKALKALIGAVLKLQSKKM